MSFRWSPPSRRAGHSRRSSPASQGLASRGGRRPALEFLEDRTLLSNTIPLSSTSWTSIGPNGITNTAPFGGQQGTGGPASGRITGIAADPTDANTVYVATAGGGVWRTSNGGITWITNTDTQPTLFTGSIAISKSKPQVLYAGTGEANNSADSYPGQGVLKSTDGGASWTLTGTTQFARKTIGKIVVDPTDPLTAYAAVSANGTDSTPGGTGVFKTTDGGTTWTNTTASVSATDTYSDLVINPATPTILYTAVGTQAGTGANGVYESTDAGKTWARAGNFLGSAKDGSGDGRISLAISASDPTELLASVAAPTLLFGPGPGLLALDISNDGGATWNPVPTAPPNYLANQGNYANVVAIDPADPKTLYAAGSVSIGNVNGVIESNDSGKTWNDFTADLTGTEPHTASHALAFDATGRLLDGNDGGIWRLQNAAPSTFRWADINGDLAITQFNYVALDTTNSNVAYGGAQGQGTSKFNDNPVWSMILGGDGGQVEVDPNSAQTVYYESSGLSLTRSLNGGTGGTKITAGIGRFDPIAQYAPFAIDPSNSKHLLFGTNHIYTSPDQGNTWTVLATPNTNGFNDNTPLVSIAISASDPKTIYAVASDAKIFVSADGGGSWTERDVTQVKDSIHQIVVDPSNALTAYAVRNRYDNATSTGHVFQTTDGGKTWADISGDLPNQPTWSFALDPGGKRLYVGNDSGVFSTTDAGKTWTRYMTGLPNAQVTSLRLDPNLGILLAGTHGRGAFEIFSTQQLGVIPTTIQGQEGIALDPTVPLAEFKDSTGLLPPSSYTASIFFGDGTSATSTDIRLLPDNNYGVFAPHTYPEEGTYTLRVAVMSKNNVSGQASSTFNIGDAPLTPVVNPTPVNATVGQKFTGVVGSFVDANPNAPVTDFTGGGKVTIDWGDNTTSVGTVTADPTGAPGTFLVSGSHTYKAASVGATLPITVTVTDLGGSILSPPITNTATVQDATLTPVPVTFKTIAGSPFRGTVAAFTSSDPNALPGSFDVKVDFGDGTPVVDLLPGSGAVTFNGTRFNVTLKTPHAFATYGTYNVTATVTDVGPNGTITNGATTTVNSTAIVSVAPITSPKGFAVTATEGQSFSGNVASFTSSNPLATAADFQGSTVQFGDGTTGPATVTALGNGKFQVAASNTYLEEGTYTFQVQVMTQGTTTPTTISSTATVNDAPITVTPLPQTATAGVAISGVIATFVDSNAQAPLSDFKNGVTINWGDGTSTAGGVQPGAGPGTFQVTGSHAYAIGQSYTISVTVKDVGGATDTASTTAVVTEGPFGVQGVTAPTLTEGGVFTGTVALLTTGNPLAVAKEFIATINWGDGTFSPGVLTNQGDGVFTVSSPTGHVFTEEGTYAVTVSVLNLSGPTASGVTQVTVADAPINAAPGSPVPLFGSAGTLVAGVIASFTEYAKAPITDFTATISWGDGTSSPGVVTRGAGGTYDVSGSNLYKAAGHFTPQVIVNDVGGSTGTIFGDVTVSDPQISSVPASITAVVGRPFSGILATFSEPNPFVTAGEFQATIDWGDGTPPTLGVITGSNGAFTVTGSHTFVVAAPALPVTVTITHLIGGSTTTATDFAHVLALLSGALSPASDSGPSNHDGITRVTSPVFSGLADPGATVILYAAPATNPAARTTVGSVVADPTGHWSVRISPLSDGVFQISAAMINTSTGAVAENLTLPTGSRLGTLTIATHGPTVSSVSLDPRTGMLHIIFQTGPASMYLPALQNAGNYVFDSINSKGNLVPLRASAVSPVALPGGKLEVNLRYNGGRALPNAGYVVMLHTAPLIDLAGNSLVEQRFVTFPQTGNFPNPDYVAQINVVAGRGSSPISYISLAEQRAAAAYVNGTNAKLIVRVPHVGPRVFVRTR